MPRSLRMVKLSGGGYQVGLRRTHAVADGPVAADAVALVDTMTSFEAGIRCRIGVVQRHARARAPRSGANSHFPAGPLSYASMAFALPLYAAALPENRRP